VPFSDGHGAYHKSVFTKCCRVNELIAKWRFWHGAHFQGCRAQNACRVNRPINTDHYLFHEVNHKTGE
jgi:hypothetical protein